MSFWRTRKILQCPLAYETRTSNLYCSGLQNTSRKVRRIRARVYDKNLHEVQHHPRYSCQRDDALIGLFPTGATR